MSRQMPDSEGSLLVAYSDINVIGCESYQKRFGLGYVLRRTHDGGIGALDNRVAAAKSGRGREGDQASSGMGEVGVGPVNAGRDTSARSLDQREHLLVPAVYLGGGTGERGP